VYWKTARDHECIPPTQRPTQSTPERPTQRTNPTHQPNAPTQRTNPTHQPNAPTQRANPPFKSTPYNAIAVTTSSAPARFNPHDPSNLRPISASPAVCPQSREVSGVRCPQLVSRTLTRSRTLTLKFGLGDCRLICRCWHLSI
jgi:hypothetical protein